MRTIITIYRTLYKYVCAVDAEYAAELAKSADANTATNDKATTHPPESPAIDHHFRSGVYLGAGMSTLILSLLPTKLLTIVEMFGYAADRGEALAILGRAGGWGAGGKRGGGDADEFEAGEPTVSTAQEGVRRSICDMALLIFHLVLSSFTFDGVDVAMAARIVNWNLKRYPEGGAFSPCHRASFIYCADNFIPRCVLPLRCRTPRHRALAAATRDRVPHQGYGCAETVP
jgi:hypothetical protein